MVKRFMLLAAAALLLVVPMVSGQSSGNASINDISQVSEIKQSMIDAVDIVRSYQFIQTNDETVIFSNKSGKVGATAASDIHGALNLTAMRAYTSTSGMVGDRNVSIQEYFINGTLYENVSGNWSRIDIPNPSRAMSRFNDLRVQVRLIDASNVTVLGRE